MDKEIEIARLQAKIQSDQTRLITSVSLLNSITLVVAVYLLDHPYGVFSYLMILLIILGATFFVIRIHNTSSSKVEIDKRFDSLAGVFEQHLESSRKP
jgi:hypothetical protein